jgi:hypothetical protein
MTTSRRCVATRIDGRACRAWAVRGSDPPLCSSHAGRARTDDVARPDRLPGPAAAEPGETLEQDTRAPRLEEAPQLEEIALLVNLALDDSLEDEVAASRIAVQRVMEELREELSPAEFARLAGLVFRGSDTIARLLRAQRELSGETADGMAGAISEALDALGDELGVEL